MAEGTYEFECMRAELLGVNPPDKTEFEKVRAERLEAEREEYEAAEANVLEQQDETLKNSGGKLDELNTILSSTHAKINRLKQTARGSLSNIFSRGNTVDEAGEGSRKKSVDSDGASSSGNINDALDNLDKIKNITEETKHASNDISKKMNSQMDKLDSLIHKAENAELSMDLQKKDMKRMLK